MTDELEVLNRLVDYHDHIAPPMVPVADDVRRGRRRVRRHRGIVTGGAALALAGIVLTASLVTGGDREAAPAPATPSPTPSPTATKVQSPETWADTAVAATDKSKGWQVPDPLQRARHAWFPMVSGHLDPTGGHLHLQENSPWGFVFERPTEGSIYSTFGRVGLVVDRGVLNPFDGCRYLTAGPPPSNGTASCSGGRFAAPDGERARIARYGRRCGAYEGGGPAPAICGDYVVAVAVQRRDGLIGYIQVEGRGTPDANPFTPAAMAAAAADPRLSLPETAFTLPSDQALGSVLAAHVPGYRASAEDPATPQHPGVADASGHLGRRPLFVQVWPAGGTPACGRSWVVECVERRVFGPDDPTTVFVGTWDEEHWADCCPKNSRATLREIVYVGPRHTVVAMESLVVREGEKAVGAELDQRLIDLVLDPRLQ
jgi:hypothetical protein